MRTIMTFAIFFVAIAAVAAPVPAVPAVKPEQVNQHHVFLLFQNRVHRELGLSAEQRIKLIDGYEIEAEKIQAEYGQQGGSLQGFDGECFYTALARSILHQKRAALVATTLELSQFVRLQQLEFQNLGLYAFRDKSVTASLKLTAEQQAQYTKLCEEFFEEFYLKEYRSRPSLSAVERSVPYVAKMVKLLTSVQKQQWEKIVGKVPENKRCVDGAYLSIIVVEECERRAKKERPAPIRD